MMQNKASTHHRADTGLMSLLMWNQHRANNAKEGMIPSLGRCLADESANDKLMWNLHQAD